MDKPFKYITDSPIYTLTYPHAYYRGNVKNNETLQKCITDTVVYYDQDTVTPIQFKLMIDKITSGGASAPIIMTKCIDDVIQALCIYYPRHLTSTNVTSLIKCMNSSHITSVEYIEGTGYKFNSSQIKSLNKAGILMIDKIASMSLAEFYTLFDNQLFVDTIKNGWDDDPDEYCVDKKRDIEENNITEEIKNKKEEIDDPNVIPDVKVVDNDNSDATDIEYNVIGDNVVIDNSLTPVTKSTILTKKQYPQYIVFKKIIDKFNIKLDEQIWDKMLIFIMYGPNSSRISIKKFINMHRVVSSLFPDNAHATHRSFLDNIIKSCYIEYDSIGDTYTDNAKRWFDEILDSYPDINFDRSSIMNYADGGMKIGALKLIIDSKYCSYDMFRDIYYWLDNGIRDIKSYIILKVVELKKMDLLMQLASMYKLTKDYFVDYIKLYPDCGWDNEQFIKVLLAFNIDVNFTRHYVNNKLIVNKEIIESIWKSDPIHSLYENCTSYTEEGFDKILKIRNEYSNLINICSSTIDKNKTLNVLKSMGKRERRIYTYLLNKKSPCISCLYTVQYILRYDIKINRQHLELIVACGYESTIIELLHISTKYDYLIPMIDIDLVIMCKNYLPRIWFYNNIVALKTLNERLELSFCPFKESKKYIFSVKQNSYPDSDISPDIIDLFKEIEMAYNTSIQEYQETALDRILNNN
jgi:hypothetical protein